MRVVATGGPPIQSETAADFGSRCLLEVTPRLLLRKKEPAIRPVTRASAVVAVIIVEVVVVEIFEAALAAKVLVQQVSIEAARVLAGVIAVVATSAIAVPTSVPFSP